MATTPNIQPESQRQEEATRSPAADDKFSKMEQPTCQVIFKLCASRIFGAVLKSISGHTKYSFDVGIFCLMHLI